MGQRVDNRSDLWSIGVILYEMITGERPFPGQAVSTIMQKVLNAPTEPPTSYNLDLPESFDVLLKNMLEKRPKDRYQTAAELKEAIVKAYNNELKFDCDGLDDTIPPVSDDDCTMISGKMSCNDVGDTGTLAVDGNAGIKPDIKSKENSSSQDKDDMAIKTSVNLDKQTEIIQNDKKDQEQSVQEKENSSDEKMLINGEELKNEVDDLMEEEGPTGFFNTEIKNIAQSSTVFFSSNTNRLKNLEDLISIYVKNQRRDFDSISFKQQLTFFLWVGYILFCIYVMYTGIAMIFQQALEAGIFTTIMSSLLLFMQKTFQQKEEFYSKEKEKQDKILNYGHQWLLIIQSIDAIDNDEEKLAMQKKLIDSLRSKLDHQK